MRHIMLYKLVRLVIHITYLQSDNYVTFMTVAVEVAAAVANQSEDLFQDFYINSRVEFLQH